jgi:F0F1-type ATP synthase assembly protein I
MSEQFSDEELAALRALIIADARRQWVVSSLAGGARWITAILAAWLIFREVLTSWVK